MIATTLATSAARVHAEVLPWLQWHADVGFRRVFILWDGALLPGCSARTAAEAHC